MGRLSHVIVPVTPFSQNCTLLYDADTAEAVVIDPGGDVADILAAIAAAAIKPTQIWLTHGHIDHAGGADELRETLTIPVIGPHRDDRPLLETLEVQAHRFGVVMAVRNVVPDRWLEDGDSVSFGEHVFEVRHCPGHAPGHVIFFNRASRFAHLGDVLFHGSIGRTDLPGGDHDALMASIRDRVLLLGDDVGFICGHGPGGRIGEERRSNPFLRGL